MDKAERVKNTPVYVKVASELRERIIQGKLNPGDILPSESALCKEYQICRDTARKSLRELENQGLIFSRPKIGYFVSTPKYADVTLQFMESMPGFSTNYLDINGKLPDADVREALQISASSKIIEFRQLIRDPQGEPAGIDVKYVPYRRAYPSVESEMRFAVFPDITSPHVKPYAYYTEFSIGVTSATALQGMTLKCPEGTPLLVVKRLMIEHSGKRIAYALRYLLPTYGQLFGKSGFTDAVSFSGDEQG